MLVHVFKSWKKHNEIQVTINKKGLEQSKIKNHPPFQKRGATSRDLSLGRNSITKELITT